MHIQNAKGLGLAIRQRRKDLGLDQQELADQIGVSRQWLIQVEKGKSSAQVGLILRTLKALSLELQITDKLETPNDKDPTSFIDLADIIKNAKSDAR